MDKIKFNNENILKLIKELFKSVIDLATHHFELLKIEFKDNAQRIVTAVIMLILGLVIAYAGLLFLGILLIQLLSMTMPLWGAILIITAVYLVLPLIMFAYAVKLLKKIDFEPKQSIDEFKKTGEELKKWLKNLKK